MGIENISIDDVIGVLTVEPQSSKEILEKLGKPQDARKFGKWMKEYRHLVRSIKKGDRYEYALKGTGPDTIRPKAERQQEPQKSQKSQIQPAQQPQAISEYDYLRKLEDMGIDLKSKIFDILLENAQKWKRECDQLQHENERLERLLRTAENEIEDLKEQKEKEGKHQLLKDIHAERKARVEMM